MVVQEENSPVCKGWKSVRDIDNDNMRCRRKREEKRKEEDGKALFFSFSSSLPHLLCFRFDPPARLTANYRLPIDVADGSPMLGRM